MIDFQAPLTHTLIPANNRVKGRFEKMFLDGRPPINVGVTSGGDLFGGTAISFSDVLGDQNFTFYAASVSQYRTFAGSYTNLSRRVQYSIQAFSQTQFYYGLQPGYLRPVAHVLPGPRRRGRDAHDQWREPVRDLPVQQLHTPRAVGGVS